eukprot:tig00000101_g4447.t1
MMEPSGSVSASTGGGRAQLLSNGARSDAPQHAAQVVLDLSAASPDGVRGAFKRCLGDEVVQAVLWDLGDEVVLAQKLTVRQRLQRWWGRFKKHFISGLMELILSLPSIAILPILLLAPYLSPRVAPIIIFLCAGLVAVSCIISALRVKAERDEMLELLRKGAGEGRAGAGHSQEAGSFHPPVWAFVKGDMIASWACGAVEFVGLLVLGARMVANLDVVSYEGYMIFFIFPLADAMRGMYDARVLDKMPSLIAYDGAGFLPTRRPLRFDPALTKFDDADPAHVRPIAFGAVRGIKLGASRVKEGEGSSLDLPYLFHVLFLTDGPAHAPGAPAPDRDEPDLDASRLTCFRILPGGARERSQVFATSVAAAHAREFLAILGARCRAAREVQGACVAVGRFLSVLEAVWAEEGVRRDKEWLAEQLEAAFERQKERAFSLDAAP